MAHGKAGLGKLRKTGVFTFRGSPGHGDPAESGEKTVQFPEPPWGERVKQFKRLPYPWYF